MTERNKIEVFDDLELVDILLKKYDGDVESTSNRFDSGNWYWNGEELIGEWDDELNKGWYFKNTDMKTLESIDSVVEKLNKGEKLNASESHVAVEALSIIKSISGEEIQSCNDDDDSHIRVYSDDYNRILSLTRPSSTGE